MSNASSSCWLRSGARAIIVAVCTLLLVSCDGGGSDQFPTIKPTPGLSLVAGKLGGPGNIDGPTGRFLGPEGVAVDAADNLYVADYGNHTVRKRAPDGVITTLAGRAGFEGSTDGIGSDARFSQPSDIAADTAGNIYVVDHAGIRKIAPNNVVTTLAPQAAFSSGSLGGVAVDVSGSVYVAGGGANMVFKVSPAGEVALLAGTGAQGSADGPAARATFSYVAAIALDRFGNVYVADRDNFTIRRISPNGFVTTVAGAAGISGATDGVGTAARFAGPQGIAVDQSGAIWIADAGDFRAPNNTIRRIGVDSQVSTIAGKVGADTAVDGVGAAASFAVPRGITVNNAGALFVADTQSSTIRKVTSAGEVTTIAGSLPAFGAVDGGGSVARFSNPQNVAVDASGTIYVADAGNDLIRKVTPAGTTTTFAGKAGVPGMADGNLNSATFAGPSGVALGADGTIYIADRGSHLIRRISPDGFVSTVAGANWPTPIQFFGHIEAGSVPVAIAVDRSGNMYVADMGMNMIRKVAPDGSDNVLTNAAAPRGVAVDNAGNVYVSDSGNGRIRRITPSGQDTVVSEAPDPGSLTIDGSGNLYVANTGNQTVQRIGIDGKSTTVAGHDGSIGVLLGDLPGSLDAPVGVTLDANGALYTTSENSVLRIVLP